MMTSIVSAGNYMSSFLQGAHVDAGLVCALVLICILIFLELYQTATSDPASGVTVSRKIKRLGCDVVPLTWILVVIFMAMVSTRVVMILFGS
jgi:hypothetical protein